MDPKKLVVGNKYTVVGDLKVCVEVGESCAVPNQVEPVLDTELAYLGEGDGVYRFDNGDGVVYLLHDDDLGNIAEM